MTTSLQLADDLLVALNSTLQDTNEFPSILVDLVQEIMCVTYPPEDGIKIVAQWMIRSLQKVIDACPASMTFTLLEGIQDGVSRWVSDECGVFSDEEYSRDVSSLAAYQGCIDVNLPFLKDRAIVPNTSPFCAVYPCVKYCATNTRTSRRFRY